MDLSVIIATYKRAAELRRTLAGFAQLRLPPGLEWEVVVVDNDSPDETEAVCREAAQTLPLRWLRETQRGQTFALNRAIDETTAPLLVFTDDDVDVDADWLLEMWRGAEAAPEAGFFGGKVISSWQGPVPAWFRENADFLRSNPRVDLGEEPVALRQPGEGRMIGANLAFRRSALELERYRTDVGPRGDSAAGGALGPGELDLEERLLRRGVSGLYLPRAMVHHRDPPYRMTLRYVVRWYYNSGSLRVRLGQVPREKLLFGVPRYLWRELAGYMAAFVFWRGLGTSRRWLAALCGAATALGSMVASREPRAGFIDRLLVRAGPRAWVWAHWPWPRRRPWQLPQLRLAAPGGGIGDELICTPIFREIKRRNPGCQITFLSRYPEFFAAHPDLEEVMKTGPGDRSPACRLSYRRVLPPPRSLIALCGESAGLLGVPEKILPPPLTPSSALVAEIAALPHPRVAIQPFSSQWTTNKNWPLAHWRAVLSALASEATVIETGHAPAFAKGEFGPSFRSFAGRTSVSDFAYLISEADLFIGPSSGGMHLANAYDIPALIIFGGYEAPTGYRFGNVRPLYNPVPCAPCWRQDCPYEHRCLREIAAETVLRAAREMLAAQSATR